MITYGKRTCPRIWPNTLTYLTLEILDQLPFVPVELVPIRQSRRLIVLDCRVARALYTKGRIMLEECITKASSLPTYSGYMILWAWHLYYFQREISSRLMTSICKWNSVLGLGMTQVLTWLSLLWEEAKQNLTHWCHAINSAFKDWENLIFKPVSVHRKGN